MKKDNKNNYSKYSADELLKLGLKNLGIEDEHNKLFKALKLYSKEIMLFNKAFNLVKVKDEKELVVSHLLDSLSAWKYFYKEVKSFYDNPKNTDKSFFIADVGSGAGFPGLPLAMLFELPAYSFPNLGFFLIERMERRCNFLQNQKLVLGLKNIEVINSEIEQLDANIFNIVTCRAFRTLDEKILDAILNCTANNGRILMYKATEYKITQDLQYIQEKALDFRLEKLNLPFVTKERHLLLIQKNTSSF